MSLLYRKMIFTSLENNDNSKICQSYGWNPKGCWNWSWEPYQGWHQGSYWILSRVEVEFEVGVEVVNQNLYSRFELRLTIENDVGIGATGGRD